MKKLRGVKIFPLKKILKTFPEAEYICTHREITLLILDEKHNHLGSIYLKEEI